MPVDIPASPGGTYGGKDWKGWADWLGTGNIAPTQRQHRPFDKARKYVCKLKLKSCAEWAAYCNGKMPQLGHLPADIPRHADRTYADEGWKGMGDWLGTGTVATHLRQYRAFKKARAFAQKLKLKNFSEWRLFCCGKLPKKGKLPSDIPANPFQTYANRGWKSMGDWLGTGYIAANQREYRSFSEARAFVRKLKLKNNGEWRLFCRGKMLHKGRLPSDIPAGPARIYAKTGWKGFGDWLGTGNVATFLKKYRPFPKARAFVHSLKLNNRGEWLAFIRGQPPHSGRPPKDIPSCPHQVYAKNGWKGMRDWLGTGKIPKTRLEIGRSRTRV